MNKKLLMALLAVLMMGLVLTGCSNEPSGDNDSDTEAGFEFASNGVAIQMLAKADTVLSALGEENTYFEAESCAYQGMDKIYTYNGFEVRTNEIDNQDLITSVLLIDDSIATPEGVALFMTKEDMIGAYGEDFTEEMGLCSYTKGKTKLSFLIKDNEITSIEYTAVTED